MATCTSVSSGTSGPSTSRSCARQLSSWLGSVSWATQLDTSSSAAEAEASAAWRRFSVRSSTWGLEKYNNLVTIRTGDLSEGCLLLLPVCPLPGWSPAQLLAGVLPVAGQQTLPHPGSQPPHLLPQGNRQVLVILQVGKKVSIDFEAPSQL